jgi:hypothetical protein
MKLAKPRIDIRSAANNAATQARIGRIHGCTFSVRTTRKL